MTPPLISIITVNFNGGDFLESTIQSVLRQSFRDFEYLVIDGGSTDHSTEIISRYTSQLTYSVSERDNGVYDAMNKGLRKATGQWVYFLNSKDLFIDENVLANAAAHLAQSEFSVLAGYVQTVSPDEGLFPKKHVDGSARELFYTHFCHQALFVRRTAYLENGMYDRRFPTFADFHVIFKIIFKEKGYRKIEQVFAFYDLGGLSANWKKVIKIFREREAIFADLGERASPLRYAFGYLKAVGFYLKKALL